MSDREKYVMGPGRRRRGSTRPKPIHSVDELLADVLGPEPTRWVKLANGRLVVENPAVCGICHRRRHRDTAHHAFMPDRAYPEMAERIGWPLPPNQDPML